MVAVNAECASSRRSAQRAECDRDVPTYADVDDRRGPRRSVMHVMPVIEAQSARCRSLAITSTSHIRTCRHPAVMDLDQAGCPGSVTRIARSSCSTVASAPPRLATGGCERVPDGPTLEGVIGARPWWPERNPRIRRWSRMTLPVPRRWSLERWRGGWPTDFWDPLGEFAQLWERMGRLFEQAGEAGPAG